MLHLQTDGRRAFPDWFLVVEVLFRKHFVDVSVIAASDQDSIITPDFVILLL
jgi:hypothetical protein